VRAVALVGSVARGDTHAGSDVDVVLLTTEPARYVESDDWIGELGGVRLLRTQQWGDITERRFALQDGTEIDCGIGVPGWKPLPETRALYDPDGLLT
jgi:predicted nucleotidyltransferase